MKKSKKIIGIVIFLSLAFVINAALQFALVPSGIVRVIIHELDRGDYKCVFLGASHGAYGIDSNIVTEKSGINSTSLCMGGEYTQDSYFLLKRVFETNKPDYIVYELDYEYLVKHAKGGVSGSSIYNSYPLSFDKIGYFKDKVMSLDYRATFFPWMDYRDNLKNTKKTINQKLTAAYWNYNAEAVEMKQNNLYYGRGFIYRIHTQNNEKVVHMNWDESRVDKMSMTYLKKMIQLCKDNNTKMILITTPVPVEKIAYTPDEFNEVFSYFSKFASDNGVEYYNMNLLRKECFSRTKDDYNDFDGHMYGDTAQAYSNVLGKFLKDIADGNLNESDYSYSSVSDLIKAYAQ